MLMVPLVLAHSPSAVEIHERFVLDMDFLAFEVVATVTTGLQAKSRYNKSSVLRGIYLVVRCNLLQTNADLKKTVVYVIILLESRSHNRSDWVLYVGRAP